jgi:hypothetical protein
MNPIPLNPYQMKPTSTPMYLYLIPYLPISTYIMLYPYTSTPMYLYLIPYLPISTYIMLYPYTSCHILS